jgi:hypothetical protein
MSKERDDFIKKSEAVIAALVAIVTEISRELSGHLGLDLRPEFKALDEALDQLKAPVDPGSPAGSKEDAGVH